MDVLTELLARYSPSGREGRAVASFVRCAERLGFRGAVDAAGNGIARRGRGRPRTVFLGHIDTVEGPLPVVRRRGRVHGRGSVDAKGALAAALVAGARFAGPGSFEVIAAVQEETDSRGARHLLRRRDVDSVIAGEPSHWDGITIGYRGDLRVVAHFRGTRSHLSSPRPTTADLALGWAASARSVEGDPGPSPFRSLTGKVAAIRAGGSGDREWADVTLDLRLPPGRSARSVLAALPRGPSGSTIEVVACIDPIDLERTNPVARALEAGIRSEGGRPTFWRKTGTSDLNLVVPVWHVPGAAYGPGDPHLDHSARESVGERELRRSVAVLEHAVEALSGRPPSASGP